MISYHDAVKILKREDINWNQKLNLMLQRDMNFRKDIEEPLATDFCYMYAATLRFIQNSQYGLNLKVLKNGKKHSKKRNYCR